MNDCPNVNLDNLGEDANLFGKSPPCKIGQYGLENNVDIIDKITSNISKRPVLKCEFKPRKNARRSIVTLGQIKKDQKLTKKKEK